MWRMGDYRIEEHSGEFVWKLWVPLGEGEWLVETGLAVPDDARDALMMAVWSEREPSDTPPYDAPPWKRTRFAIVIGGTGAAEVLDARTGEKADPADAAPILAGLGCTLKYR